MLNKTKQGPVDANALTGRNFLKGFAKQEASRLHLAVLVGALSTVFMLLQWVLFAWLAEQVIVKDLALFSELTLISILLFSAVAKAVCTRFQTSLAQTASLNIRQSIRHKLQQHWRETSPVLLKRTSNGAFATQYVEEVEAMDGYFSKYWPQQALSLLSPLLILAVVAYLNWLCAILLLISAPLIPIFMILVGMGAEKLNQQYSTIRQRLAGHFLDRVANLSSIRLLGAQNSVFDEVERNSTAYRKVIMRTLKVAFLSSTVLEFFTSVAIAALAIYIGFSLYGAIVWGPAASLTLFSGLAILILAPEFFQPMRNLSQFYHDRASALGAANNLVQALALQNDALPEKFQTNESSSFSSHSSTNCSTQADTPSTKLSSLSLQELVLGYASNNPLTQPINLEAKHGDIVAVTGESGSGKTSLLNTLAQFISPLSGHINFSPAYPATMTYLPQQAWIKNQSIYENLRSLAPQASKDEMLNVLTRLGLANELELKHKGLDTLIGEHGKGLSGGQMQRIAFARILLNPAPLILLDEPTARLDELSKAYIIDALKILREQALIVIATHDPLIMNLSSVQLSIAPASSVIPKQGIKSQLVKAPGQGS